MLVFIAAANAQDENPIEATTTDGQRVLLKENGTWHFISNEVGVPSNSAVLTVTKVTEMQDACRLDLRLQNNLNFKIRSLVPRLSVYNQAGIQFETASLSFASIKPTGAKYTKIQFTGIGCHEIAAVRVLDASRCRMGDIDMFNEEEGQCLSHIYIEPSDLINISK